MGNVVKQIPAFFGGVSQQPEQQRFDEQCKEQVNSFGTIDRGLYKRQPTHFIKRLINSDVNTNPSYHLDVKGPNQEYLIETTGSSVIIYDTNGDAQPLYGATGTNPPDFTYLSGITDPNEDLAVVSVNDYTIIANKTKTVEMFPRTVNVVPKTVFYVVKGTQHGQTYSIKVGGLTSSHTTNADTTTAFEKTDAIAASLVTSLGTNTNVQNIQRVGSTIKFETTNDSLLIEAGDSFGNSLSTVFEKELDDPLDLPAEFFKTSPLVDYVFKITPGNASLGYYLKYSTDGVWRETVAEDVDILLDPSTMPHAIVREDNGVGGFRFRFIELEWQDRQVGDDNITPKPSMVDNQINEVVFYKNRLCFLSLDNIIMSRTNDFFNIFPTSAREQLADDPIDLTMATSQTTILHHAQPFNDQLLLFSDNLQFTLTSNGPLTPTTASVNQTTAYVADNSVRPVAAGPNVYFNVPRGNFSSIREYFVEPNTLINDATNISEHVPTYVPGNIREFSTNNAEDILTVLPEDSTEVYMYNFKWNGAEKVQSAWHKFDFSTTLDKVLSVQYIEDSMYIIGTELTSIMLYRIDLNEVNTGDLKFLIHLDKQVDLTGSYSAINDETTYTVPANYTTDIEQPVIDKTTGRRITPKAINPTNIVLFGDTSSINIITGYDYEMLYTFTKWFIKNPITQVGDTDGRLQLDSIRISYQNTGSFTIRTLQDSDTTQQLADIYPSEFSLDYEYSGFDLGKTGITGELMTHTNDYTALIQGEARYMEVSLVNDGYQPSNFISAYFKGTFSTRGRRV